MAAKKNQDEITAKIEEQEQGTVRPTVQVFIPLREDTETDLTIDQTENVTINGVTTQIRRGVPVDVPVPVFMQLKNRYPNI